MDVKSILTIIVNYNGIVDTIECIESVLASNVKSDILIIDNASEDGRFICEKLSRYNVTVKVMDKNVGFGGANNIGFRYAADNHYDYVMLLNNDTVIEQNMIEMLLAHVNENTIAVPIMNYYDTQMIWYAGGNINKYTGKITHLYHKTQSAVNNNFYCTFATGCCWMMSCKTLEKIGFFDDYYFMYHEDVDYSIRALLKGIKIKLVSHAKLYHKVGMSSGGDESPFYKYYNSRNRLYCICKFQCYYSRIAIIYTLITVFFKVIISMFKSTKRTKALLWAVWDYIIYFITGKYINRY